MILTTTLLIVVTVVGSGVLNVITCARSEVAEVGGGPLEERAARDTVAMHWSPAR